jgi:transcriptional regulator with XRE-family HTH domain
VHSDENNASNDASGHYAAPAEAVLIRRSRERCDPALSRRQAATRAGISASQWSDIERGHKQAGSGITVPVQATAATLAVMASIVGVTADELATAGRLDAARQLDELNRDQNLRRRIASVPGLGFIGDLQLMSADGQELLSLVAAGLDDLNSSSLPTKAQQELTTLFVDNLIRDAARRVSELRLMLRIAEEAVRPH